MRQSVWVPVTTGVLPFGLVAIGQMSNVGLIPRTTGETVLAALRSLRPLLARLVWSTLRRPQRPVHRNPILRV